jgi:hypothetical protein
MDSLTYIVALCALVLVPAGLFTALWLYVIRRGWGSRWLLTTLVTVFMSLLFIVLSLVTQERSILFLGLGTSVLGGILFYVSFGTSPIFNVLIGKNQKMQSSWVSLHEEERTIRKQSTKLAIRDILLTSFIQYMPLAIGLAIILLSRGTASKITISLAIFIMGFTGILRIVLRPKHVPSAVYSSKSKMIGNILITVFAWSLALYILFSR